MAEQFANNAQTTLGVALGPAETTVDVSSAAGFPSLAPFRILIDSELMTVTAGAGTTSWVVTRGIEGTTPAAHNAGAVVSHIITAGALADLVDLVENAASLPAVGADGDVLTTVAGEWAAAAPAGGGGGGGSIELIEAVTLVAPAADVFFAAIPDTYRSLMVIWRARGATAGLRQLLVRFNGDVGGNYDWTYGVYLGSTVGTGGSGIGSTIPAISAMGGSDQQFSSGRFEIPAYAQLDAERAAVGQSTVKVSLATSGIGGYWGTIYWRNTVDAISSLTLAPNAGDFEAGSMFVLYGVS